MRIGIDIRAIGHQRTGDETYTLQLVKSLAKNDDKNIYFLYTTAESKKDIDKIRKLLAIQNTNFQIKTVKALNRFLWTAWSLPQQAKKDGVDVLHVQYITPLFFTGNLKIITTIHDVSFARYPQFIAKKDLWLLKLFIPLSLKKADKVIAVSKFTKEEIMDVYNIPGSKIEVVYNGGVAEEFLLEHSSEKVLRFKKKYDIIKPYLLYLGTLQPRKNIPFLIKAFEQLKNKYKNNSFINDLELVLRGSRHGRNYDLKIDIVLDKLQKTNKAVWQKIKFVDYVSNEDAPLIFSGAEVFCFTSFYEGFGLPALEAMVVNTPIVTPNSSCFPEIIGEGGILYRENNINDWTDKVYRILTDVDFRKEMKNRGRERSKDFSWDKNAKKTIQIYNLLT